MTRNNRSVANTIASLVLAMMLSLVSTFAFATQELETPVANNVAASSVTASAMEREQGATRTISTSSMVGSGSGCLLYTSDAADE